MNAIPILIKIGRLAAKYYRPLLAGGAIAAGAITGITAVKATITARDILEDEVERRIVHNEKIRESDPEDAAPSEEYLSERLTKKEVVVLTWKCYIIPLLSFIAMGAAVVGVVTLDKKKLNVAMGLYSASEMALKEYKDKTKALVGDKKADEIENKIAEDILKAPPKHTQKNKNVPGTTNYIRRTSYGDTPFIDAWSGQRFYCDYEHIRKTINDLNQQILYSALDGGCPLNDLYYYLGINTVQEGDSIGWDSTNLIDVRFDSDFDKNDGIAWAVMTFVNRPRYL